VSYKATILGTGALYFHETSLQGQGTLTEQPQQKFIDGVLQTPGMSTPRNWPEDIQGFTIASPDPTKIMYIANGGSTDALVYANLGGASGTVTCTWTVTR
jgi:hypothetical protein